MRRLIACLCLAAAPASAWEFTPTPVCTLSHAADGSSLRVTYDPRGPEYAITLRRPKPWPAAPVFAIRFAGPRELTISTTRHRLSEGGTALTVTDRGFGNVLDGLQFNDAAIARTGAAALSVPLDGAAPAVEAFRACTSAPSV
ncbi:MAG: excinuclease ABC subunit B [Pseudomonadota bacterium]